MNLLILNPNSSVDMTSVIEKSAEDYFNDRINFECVCNETAPEFISGYKDKVMAARGIIDIIEEKQSGFEAIVLACHGDPNIEAAREVAYIPVMGVGECSMKIASMLGEKFSIITPDEGIIPGKRNMVKNYNLSEHLASIRVSREAENDNPKENLLKTVKNIAEEDSPDSIILGCADYSRFSSYLRNKVEISVIDSLEAGFMIAEGLMRTNL